MILQEPLFWMTAAVFVVAVLYSSVGHAGASGYIAIMALFNLAPAVIKPTALVLNIAVACIGSVQFWRAGYFRWQLFWPFAVLAIPGAFLGGSTTLPTPVFRTVVGLVLCFSAVRLLVKPPAEKETVPPPKSTALGVGAGLGLLAGLTGTGGGIFLTPLMMFKHWASTKTIAAVSAVFILVNSFAGLAGNFSSARRLPDVASPLLIAAVAGGVIGSYLGSQQFSPTSIKRLLAAVLGVAAGKLMLT